MRRNVLTRTLALVLALALVGSGMVFAASFSDLEGHWAEEYMLELNELGYLKGYDDNTMRPESSITGATALTLMSRLFDVEEAALDLAREEYGAFAQEVIPSTQSWLNDEDVIVVCLAGGVISDMTFRVRQYTVEGTASLLLPLRQALAIAAQQEGAELSIGYADGGAGTISAGWLAE